MASSLAVGPFHSEALMDGWEGEINLSSAEARGPKNSSRTISPPRLPQAKVDISMPRQSGRIIPLNRGGDFQSALVHANCGDTIVLQAGATFTGNFVLPNKPCSGWVVIESSLTSNLPVGTRVGPAQAKYMAMIQSGRTASSPINVEAGAHNYRFVGVEVTTAPGTWQYALLNFDASQKTPEQEPHYMIVDRCYIHGDSITTIRRAISFQVAYGAVVDSYITEIHEPDTDSQAIAVWNGEGPFLYQNNYLSAASENIIFGGSAASLPNPVPSDIIIVGNHITKNTAWRSARPSWSVKNLLELKCAQRVLIQGNLLEYSWAEAQVGYALLLTPRGTDGANANCTVADVTIIYNMIQHAGSGIEVGESDNGGPSQPTQRLLIENNIFLDINPALWGGDGRTIFLASEPGLQPPHDIIINHNDLSPDGGNHAMMLYGDPKAPLVFGMQFTNNIGSCGPYGVFQGGTGPGLPYLSNSFPGLIWNKIVLLTPNGNELEGTHWPPGTYFSTPQKAQFTNYSEGNYTLRATSLFHKAGTDGKDIGADINALKVALEGVRQRAPRSLEENR